jgi:hypothetical protein
VKAFKVDDKEILTRPMTLLTEDATVIDTVNGTGATLIVDHTTDNTLVTFRFRHRDVNILAAEEAFDIGDRHFGAGAFIVPDADRAMLEPSIKQLGLWAVAVRVHRRSRHTSSTFHASATLDLVRTRDRDPSATSDHPGSDQGLKKSSSRQQ